MKNICDFLKVEEGLFICKMSGRKIDDNIHSCFCTKDSLTTCPTYIYYLQEYIKITSNKDLHNFFRY